MKHFTYKWLQRVYLLFAFYLVLAAICLSLLRILVISIEDYKEDLTLWFANEYQINLAVTDITAGVDFSGIILTLNDINIADSGELPFALNLDYLFIHLDFWDSVTQRKLNFNRISVKGAELTVKNNRQGSTDGSLVTFDSLQTLFLQQLKQVSIKQSRIHLEDRFGKMKTMVIDNLNWINSGDFHQGVGNATLANKLSNNSLEFVINLTGEYANNDDPLRGELYIEADNFDVSEYLVERVNSNIGINDAVLGFQLWSRFSLDSLQQVQVAFNNSQLAWTSENELNKWQLNSGLLQFTNTGKQWLFDSYQLDIEKNNRKLAEIVLSGSGTNEKAQFNLSGVNIKELIPFYLLNASLPETTLTTLKQLKIGAEIKQFAINKEQDNGLQFSAQLKAFNNQPEGAIPGIGHADISFSGTAEKGKVTVTLPKQAISFDGQFSRSMPIEQASLPLQWEKTEQGFKLFSERSLLKTTDLDTTTQFSLLFPNEKAQSQSPFLSLYSYVSLNDASKAQYYFPIKAMGDDVFNYLEPTIKKGKVDGAKILWYGAFNNYPYSQHDGIFQAWVPVRNAQYDFYGQWQGLTGLDLDLLFENDYLTMDALQASLGEAQVDYLSAKIDHLAPNGVLTIDAALHEDAAKISRYLINSPLKESVGEALQVIEVKKPLSGKLQLTIPFNSGEQLEGEVSLANNNIDLHLADNIAIPLKSAQGKFSFINGDLRAKNITAKLFGEDIKLNFSGVEKSENYQVNADITGNWRLQQLASTLPEIAPLQLSGGLDWSANVDFSNNYSGGYQYKVALNSATQGVVSKLPAPFDKNALQSWPSNILVSGDQNSSRFNFNIKNKLDLLGELNYQGQTTTIPYYTLNIGRDKVSQPDKSAHLLQIALDNLNLGDWYQHLQQSTKAAADSDSSLWRLDKLLIDIKYASLFEQPLNALKVDASDDKQKWSAQIDSDNLQGKLEYRYGTPMRLDFDISKLNFQEMDLAAIDNQQTDSLDKLRQQSDNLVADYPELFVSCISCTYGEYDLSPLDLHIYPTKSRLNIDYIKLGTESEYTKVSGVWDQRRTNIVVDMLADKHNNIINRLGFVSPVVFKKAESSGAFNWVGAPWQFNVESLNGAFSARLEDGSITEVSDSGARLLSIFSLEGIRRSLNIEFNNVFAKGFNFDEFTFSANINDGIVKNDDFYLDGSAGKIVGGGLIDLANQETNYQFSYSPAVTSSLPVLAAFAINPLTGAAVLLLTKILEPVVETIVRVDFSAKGPINDPEIKLISRKKGKVKLQNSEVLEQMNEQKQIFLGTPL